MTRPAAQTQVQRVVAMYIGHQLGVITTKATDTHAQRQWFCEHCLGS